MKILAVLAAAVLASSLPATAAPLRHLEYGFSTYPTVKVAPSSIGSIDGPGTGTMSVDFLGSAPDGGQIVEVQEWWWYAIRPEQSRSCEVYSNGGVTCDEYPIPTLAENALLPLLASDFVRGDASAPWHASYTLSYPDNFYSWNAAIGLNVVGSQDGGRVVNIALNGALTPMGGPSTKRLEVASIAYDRVSGVPVAVHEERAWQPARGLFSGFQSIDLKLKSDSGRK